MFYKSKIIFFILTFSLIGSAGFAKDLFVAPGGSDSVTYDNNDINNPWHSVEKAFTSVETGDHVYFREGNYSISSSIQTKYGNNGTSSNPVTFSNYNDESVTFTSSINVAIMIDRDYYQVSGITFSAPGVFWEIAHTLSATHFELSNCTGTVTVPGGGDNLGCVRFQSSRANDGRIENCIFYGPGSGVNENTAGVFIFRTQGVKILNCEFTNIPRAIFYKHTCIAEDTGIEFAYNYFHGNKYGIVTVSQYSDIHDNLFVDGGFLSGTDGGTGDDGSNAGSDHNNIYHNTFYNCTIELIRSGSNDGSGAQYNIIKDNIFTQTANIFQYDPAPHYSNMDYNLYILGAAVRNNRISYSLSSWQSFYGSDAHSIEGAPSFLSASPSTIGDYTLTSGSVGKNSASDGRDMGADISLVGIAVTDKGGIDTGGGLAPPNGLAIIPVP